MDTPPAFAVVQFPARVAYDAIWLLLGLPLMFILFYYFGHFEDNARNLWNYLLAMPLLLAYQYGKVAIKQRLRLCADVLQLETDEQPLGISVAEIASYCTTVQASAQYGHAYLLRISLKDQRRYLIEMPAGSFRTLRRWFMSHGLRARRQPEDRLLMRLDDYYFWLQLLAIGVYGLLLGVLGGWIVHGNAIFQF